MVDQIKILSKDYIDNDIKYMNDNIVYLKNILSSVLKFYRINVDKCDINVNYFSPLTYQFNITDVSNIIDDIDDNTKVNIIITVNHNVVSFDSLTGNINPKYIQDCNGIVNFKETLDDDLNRVGLYISPSLVHKLGKSILNINCDYTPQRYEKLIYVLTNRCRRNSLIKLKLLNLKKS